MDTLIRDLRFGARNLAKDRMFTMVAVLSLALGVGATTAIYSVFEALFLRPLPAGPPASTPSRRCDPSSAA